MTTSWTVVTANTLKNAMQCKPNVFVKDVPSLIAFAGISATRAKSKIYKYRMITNAGIMWESLAYIGLHEIGDYEIIGKMFPEKGKQMSGQDGMKRAIDAAKKNIESILTTVVKISDTLKRSGNFKHLNSNLYDALLASIAWGAPLSYLIQEYMHGKKWSGNTNEDIILSALAVASMDSDEEDEHIDVLNTLIELGEYDDVMEVIHSMFIKKDERAPYLMAYDAYRKFPSFKEELKEISEKAV